MFKVLVIAEAANPEWTSVPLVGWNLYSALKEVASCHVVTQIRNRNAFVRSGLVEDKDFTAIDSEFIAAHIYKLASLIRGGEGKGWTTSTALSSLSYYYFEYLVWRKFGNQIRSGEFDIVHRITPLSPTAVSLIAGKCKRAGVPFIMGPLNGGLPWPREFNYARHKEKEWLSYVRSAYKLLPGYSATRSNSNAIIVGSSATASQIASRFEDKCIFIAENGIETEKLSNDSKKKVFQLPLKLIFLGRLVPYKGCDMVLEAIQEYVKQGLVRFKVVGDGPERESLESLAKRLEISNEIEFLGNQEHSVAYEELAKSHALAFPSVREFGGAVVIEAMANGTVPIIVNYGGPADTTTDQTSIRLNLGDRKAIVGQMRERIGELITNPEQLEPLSEAGRERVLELFTWEKKAQQVNEVYKWVLGKRSDKPDFKF